MKVSLFIAYMAALSTTVLAQVVHWDIEKRPPPPGLRRRTNDGLEQNLSNKQAQGGYFATVNVGTPAQEVTIQLDTGSSDLWFPHSGAEICLDKEPPSNGCSLGSFDPEKSSSFNNTGFGRFEITYADNDAASGDYFQDSLGIGGVVLHNFTMAVAIKTSSAFGIAGVGYASSEASKAHGFSYPNLPLALQEGGFIKSVAYSLWLNDKRATQGNILFGAIDTKKYVGELARVDILADPELGTYTDFTVPLTWLEVTSVSGRDVLTQQDTRIRAILDSGTTLTTLPTDLAYQTWKEVGANYSDKYQSAIVPCSLANHSGYFSFGFAGPKGPRVNVTMDQLVVPTGTDDKFTDGAHKDEQICSFGITNQTDPPYLLGDTMLRSAYVVYDLENNQIGIAPTKFNTTESNIVAFPSKGAPIPSATIVPSQNSTQSLPPKPPQTGLTAADGFQSAASATHFDSVALMRPQSWIGVLVMVHAFWFAFTM